MNAFRAHKRTHKHTLYTWGLGILFTAVFCIFAVPYSAYASSEMHSVELKDAFLPEAQLSSSATTNHSTTTFTTDVITTDRRFNAFGLRFHNIDSLPETTEITVRTWGTQGEQTTTLHLLDGDLKSALPEHTQVTEPAVVETADAFAVEISGVSHSTIQDLEFIHFTTSQAENSTAIGALDTSSTQEGGAVEPIEPSTQSSGTASIDIVSRAQWGADESLRFNSSGNETWPQKTTKTKAFIVHHTAGSNGGSNPASSVNAIYRWHTQTLGWGDIGYNFLIDPAGNIYKGRKGTVGGGVNVIGGHTFNSTTNTDYNPNTIGIALLGCYQHDSNCSTQHSMTSKMEDALVELIAALSLEAGIEPQSQTTLQGQQVKRILGHQNLDSTLCPGDSVLDELGTIRKSAQAQYETLSTRPFQADITTALLDGAEVSAAEGFQLQKRHELLITYTNTGTRKWRKQKTLLKIYNGTGKKRTALGHKSWKDRFAKIRMNEEFVDPGETATFTIPLKGPKAAVNRKIVSKLFINKNKVYSSSAKLTLPFVEYYAGEVVSNSLPLAMFAQDTQTVSVTFTNTGEKKWRSEAVELYMNGKAVKTLHSFIHTDEQVTFSFPYTAPKFKANTPTRTVTFELKKRGKRINGTRHVRTIGIHQ